MDLKRKDRIHSYTQVLVNPMGKNIFACLDDQMLILVGFVPCDSTKALFFDAETRLNHLKSTFSVGSPPLINQPFFSG